MGEGRWVVGLWVLGVLLRMGMGGVKRWWLVLVGVEGWSEKKKEGYVLFFWLFLLVAGSWWFVFAIETLSFCLSL